MRRLLVVLILVVAASRLEAAQRRVALIVDTSGSMDDNDPARYAVQIAKILSDLVDDQDKVAIIRFPSDRTAGTPSDVLDALRQLAEAVQQRQQATSCSVPADRRLMATLDGSDRARFKAEVDRLLQPYSGATNFGAALRTAAQFLGNDRSTPRLLLMLSDAREGFGSCVDAFNAILHGIGSTGGMVSLVKLGGYRTDDFAGNPEIQFREDVQDGAKLIGAVANVYQRFIGGGRVQTGAVSGNITVKVDEHVKEAFLVVAAETPLGDLRSSGGNPAADRVELDFRGGGQTTGIARDGRARGYRIVRLTNPGGGSFTFSAPPGTTGGWMLVEDFALAVQLMSQAPVPVGQRGTVQFQVIDQRTGKRVTDDETLAGLTLEARSDAGTVRLTGEGAGVYSTTRSFDRPGTVQFDVRMRGNAIDRSFTLPVEVANVAGRLESQTQERADAGIAVPVRVKLTGNAPPPATLTAETGDGRISLNDKGVEGDTNAGDGVYSGTWTPGAGGSRRIHVDAGTGSPIASVDFTVNVAAATVIPPSPPTVTVSVPPPPPAATLRLADVNLGTADPLSFSKVATGQSASSTVRLRDGRIDRSAELEISTDFDKRRATLEIQTPAGWRTLSATPIRVPVTSGQAMAWPVRLKVGECPDACSPSEIHYVTFVARVVDAAEQRLQMPLRVEILPEAWYVCWRRQLIASMILFLSGIVAHGILSPSRFARRVGVQMSPGEDLAEGYFFPFRAARGSRSGFYRDSQLYLSEDFRVSRRKRGGFVRLRADKKTIRVRPENGRAVWRQGADGSWEPLPANQEVVARPGSVYRNDGRSVYFDIRTK